MGLKRVFLILLLVLPMLYLLVAIPEDRLGYLITNPRVLLILGALTLIGALGVINEYLIKPFRTKAAPHGYLKPKSLSVPKSIFIPFSKNVNFTGRQALLDDLRTALGSGENVALTQTHAITGLGGVGKTQLALEYSYRHLNDYDILWWLRSDTPITLREDYVKLATRLDLPEKELKDTDIIVEAVKSCLEARSKWLLVFDNAKDPADIQEYLPRGGRGHIIITSRNINWSNLARPLAVSKFERNESIEFICKRTGQEDGANVLAEALGDLPLALEHAGAYISEAGISLRDYLQRFQKHRTKLFEHAEKPIDYPDTVVTTWNMNFQEVQVMSPAGADLLRLFSYLAPDDILRPIVIEGASHLPEHLASAAKDELEFDNAVTVLRHYSLVDVTENGYSIHRLVQTITRDRLDENEQKKWAETAVKMIDSAFPKDHPNNPESWPECALLLPHALAAAGHADELGVAPENTGRLLNNCGTYLQTRGEFAGAKSALKRAIEIGEKLYGPDHPKVATMVNNLGSVLKDLGDLEGAKKCFERALEIDEKVYGSDHHPLTKLVLENLKSLQPTK